MRKTSILNGLIVVGVALTCFSFGGPTAQAKQTGTYQHKTTAKWHKGTPKRVRGKFKTKHYGADLQMVIKIHSKTIWFWGSGMPIQHGYNLHYKKTGHNKYVIRYDTHASGKYRGEKNLKVSSKKVGKTFQVHGYGMVFHKY